eukprot:13099029-Heterocapsa_arctica.AAC.1
MKYEAEASISRRTTPCAVKRSLPLDVQHEHGPEPVVSINNIYTNFGELEQPQRMITDELADDIEESGILTTLARARSG